MKIPWCIGGGAIREDAQRLVIRVNGIRNKSKKLGYSGLLLQAWNMKVFLHING